MRVDETLGLRAAIRHEVAETSQSRPSLAIWRGSKLRSVTLSATADQFLGEVAAHLVEAGGKRIRPTLTLCAAYAVDHGSRPRHTDASPAPWPSSWCTSAPSTTTT